MAPLLKSTFSKHSTYWTFNERQFEMIYNREQLGCFKVAGLRDCFLLDLNHVARYLLLQPSDQRFQDQDVDLSRLAIENSKFILDLFFELLFG